MLVGWFAGRLVGWLVERCWDLLAVHKVGNRLVRGFCFGCLEGGTLASELGSWVVGLLAGKGRIGGLAGSSFVIRYLVYYSVAFISLSGRSGKWEVVSRMWREVLGLSGPGR